MEREQAYPGTGLAVRKSLLFVTVLPRSSSRPPASGGPVLLLGAGTGEATCGILYLAGYLRRHGIETWVRLYDDGGSDEEVTRELERFGAAVHDGTTPAGGAADGGGTSAAGR